MIKKYGISGYLSPTKKILDRFGPYVIMKKCVQNTYVLVHKS